MHQLCTQQEDLYFLTYTMSMNIIHTLVFTDVHWPDLVCWSWGHMLGLTPQSVRAMCQVCSYVGGLGSDTVSVCSLIQCTGPIQHA